MPTMVDIEVRLKWRWDSACKRARRNLNEDSFPTTDLVYQLRTRSELWESLDLA